MPLRSASGIPSRQRRHEQLLVIHPRPRFTPPASRPLQLLVYSPKTSYPNGDRFQAIANVGVVTGEEPEPSTVITGGFRRRADLREIDPLPLEVLRSHLPTSRIRFGFFELSPEHAKAIWDLVPAP